MINQQLLDYVRQQLQIGVTKDAIKQTAAQGGWSSQDTDEAYTTIEIEKTNPLSSVLPTSVTTVIDTKTVQPRNSYIKFALLGTALTVLLALVGGGGYFLFTQLKPQDVLAQALTTNATLHTYSMKYTVTIKADTGNVILTGTANVDRVARTFSGHSDMSVAAGTSTTPAQKQIGLSIDSIIIGKDVYAKVALSDPTLSSLVKLPSDWLRFDLSSSSMPGAYTNVSYANETQDTFTVFSAPRDKIIVKSQKEEMLNGKNTTHYNISFTPEFISTLKPQLQDFYNKRATQGIDLWIDKSTKQVVQMTFTGVNYAMSSEITSTNQPLHIEAPANALSYVEFQTKQFESQFESTTPIQLVSIGSYGNISSQTLSMLTQTISNETGVQAKIISHYTDGVPNAPGVYDAQRKQNDGDVLWQYFYSLTQKSGNAYRYVVLVDSDLYTKIEKDKPYIFSRSLPKVNTILISTAHLWDSADSSNTKVSQDVYDSRLRKLVLRTLGVSVGLSLTPSASNSTCVMYQPTTLSDLDKAGEHFCDPEKGVLPKLFVQNAK